MKGRGPGLGPMGLLWRRRWGKRQWECVSPDAITGSLLGPLPPLWVFTGDWIPQKPLEVCTDSRSGQHTKLSLLWGQFRKKVILYLPGPHAPWAQGQKKEIPCVEYRRRGRRSRLKEGGTNHWLIGARASSPTQVLETQ